MCRVGVVRPTATRSEPDAGVAVTGAVIVVATATATAVVAATTTAAVVVGPIRWGVPAAAVAALKVRSCRSCSLSELKESTYTASGLGAPFTSMWNPVSGVGYARLAVFADDTATVAAIASSDASIQTATATAARNSQKSRSVVEDRSPATVRYTILKPAAHLEIDGERPGRYPGDARLHSSTDTSSGGTSESATGTVGPRLATDVTSQVATRVGDCAVSGEQVVVFGACPHGQRPGPDWSDAGDRVGDGPVLV